MHGRGTAAERGYDSRWQRYSVMYRKQHPLCVTCEAEGKTVPSECVDHIVAHRGDNVLLWDSSNHRALCWACHSKKTVREDGGLGRAKKVAI